MKSLPLSKYQQLFAILFAMTTIFGSANEAHAIDAKNVLQDMNSKERYHFVSGVVTGLAQARWIADRPDNTGTKCINDWYFRGGDENWLTMLAWLRRHPDKPAGALIYVLLKRECGE